MTKLDSFSINPGTAMMDVIGHSGYTFNFAIADIVDNCISAGASSITIFFDLDNDNPYLYIKDNGKGMSLVKLKEAAVIGFQDIDEYRDADDLGRYSTGLKSATRSFCNSIVVSSKELNKSSNSIRIDYKHIVESKKWEAFILKNAIIENELDSSGTIVLCEQIDFLKVGFDKSNIYDKLDSLEESLSHIFGKYILSNKLKIEIKVKESKPVIVKGWNPFSLPENKTTKVVYEKNHDFCGSKIKIKAYILPVYNNLSKQDQMYMQGRGLLEQSGFYIYRNKRLIQEGGWLNLDGIGLDDKSKYARIEVEIPAKLDKQFQINFSKNCLVIPDQLTPFFIEVAKKARKESRNNFNFQKHPEIRKTTKKDSEKIWKTSKTNNGIILTVNMDHPVIKELAKEIPVSTLKSLFNVLSKSLPIGMIQSQETTTVSYTENELIELMTSMHKKLSQEGFGMDEIKKRMAVVEPFKDYKEVLVEYFDKVGGNDD